MKRLILLLFLLATACIGSQDERSILENSNCKLPCWNGIVAGETTEDELLQFLEYLPDVEQKSIRNTNQPWNIFDNQIFFSFEQGLNLSQRPKIRGYAYTTNTLLGELIICGETGVSIGEVIEEAGEPDYILSGDDITGSRLVILTIPQKGISFSYTTDKKLNEKQYEFSANTQIDCLDLFDPNLYEKLLDTKLLSGGYYNAEETLKVMYPWDGYGNLDEKYPPRQP